LQLRSDIMAATVDLLNEFGAYLQAENNSPEEDQMEAAMQDRIVALIDEGNRGLAGHMLLALVALVHHCADPELVQGFLNDQSVQLLEELEQLNAED
jgi:hypothetical protein